MPDPALVTGRLNVDDFVNQRKDDIKQLEQLLTTSGTNSKKRAFQSLPRVERRRAASHEPKRLPHRNNLRKKAELESIRDNSLKKKPKKRIDPLHSKDYTPTDQSTFNELCKLNVAGRKFANRQRNKIWLPTHIWHKKRAHLCSLANFEVPLTPTQKQFRRSYRLANHVEERGAMAFDTSFYSTLVARKANNSNLDAFHISVNNIFNKTTLPLYLKGAKHWQGLFLNKYPATLHWLDELSFVVQCNPLVFEEVWEKLKTLEIDLEDCRFAIGSIDLLGPRKNDILRKVFGFKNELMYRHSELISVGPPQNKSIFSKQDRLSCLENGKPKNVNQNVTVPAAVYLLDDGRVRVLLPIDWVLPFWLLIFKNRNSVLIGGQKELHQLAFENHLPFFPLDFINTNLGFNAFKNQSDLDVDHLRTHLCRGKRTRSDYIPFVEEFVNNNTDLQFVYVRPVLRGVPQTGSKIMHNGELLGVCTTGNFSLKDAHGAGIGIIKRNAFLEGLRCLVVKKQSEFEAELSLVSLENVSRVL